ncbi:peptidoglycan-binding protein [Pseudoflavonifractor sp. 60]|uniref:peptidoglycan-binding domain-containing protein n=1 Tax=Pseudoflavonifractor sp. 60 TaxID=2304576 RepID=UPI0013700EBE|nr:peptidoglycan-binding protein [Pseudoflavonifractor sp. 60]NBI67817.1 peptidoglycan-binding protein [Pseudoflavonifractor sp. 60]
MNFDLGQELLEREMLANPVSSLQYMLRQLSATYQFLPQLVVDGVFGERTLEAVMRFQREAGLPVTGIVDQATWDKIRDAWLAQESKNSYARATRIFPSEGIQVHEGESKEYLIVPQTMFNILAKQFEGIIPCQADGCNGPASAGNIRWLQRAAGLPQTGCMDTATWDALSHLYEIFVVQDTDCIPAFTGGWG